MQWAEVMAKNEPSARRSATQRLIFGRCVFCGGDRIIGATVALKDGPHRLRRKQMADVIRSLCFALQQFLTGQTAP
jgi:hypothetical protein